jgi:hypothetical protein
MAVSLSALSTGRLAVLHRQGDSWLFISEKELDQMENQIKSLGIEPANWRFV